MEEHGKSPEYPIRLSSIESSLYYLDCLVTEKGFNILYHRAGSIYEYGKIIDHYELIDGEGNYDDIYIDIYAEEDLMIPPKGYLFNATVLFADEMHIAEDCILESCEGKLQDYLLESYGVNYRDTEFPNSLIDNMIENFIIVGKRDDILSTFARRLKTDKNMNE